VVDIASGEVPDPVSEAKRATRVKGRAGGVQGGPARAAKLSEHQRSEIAKKAARARWKSSNPYSG
jgi:hypothetical protein